MRFQNIPQIIVCVTFVFLVSCSNSNVAGKLDKELISQTYVYECSGGYNFIARVENENVWLFLPNQTIKLPHVVSGSGAKYSEGDKLFWNKGEEALLELADEKHKGCINNHAKAIWEDAKLNGWDFRAVGNEPGWHILISRKNRIVFISNYEKIINTFTTPEPLINQTDRTATYLARENGHVLELILKGTKCLDSMNDESFETTVTVILDGKTFNGCGRSLH